jgi:hypothetical protein
MGIKSRSNYALSVKISQEEFDRIFKKDKEEKKESEEKKVDLLGRVKK